MSNALTVQQPVSMTHRAETATSAIAAQAMATVQARYVMALQSPRDVDTVRIKLLSECKRPGFAEVAVYARPAGKKKDEESGRWVDNIVRGPSIRFAEACARISGNILVQSPVLFED